ncbi:MAG: competence/damage-inducible protein A [Candidatus Binatia bacterium]|nr:MAG: competence/damage-inducible protein A [Candidatus Binatia bacterium]
MIEKVALISTGDELTTGRTVDTNANFLADKLFTVGFEVVAVLVVGDESGRIGWAWRQAMEQAEVVISTGGLGPTADDLTTEALAQVTGRPLVLDEKVAESIRQRFAAMGREMPLNNLKQARFPQGATVLPNPLGTAPGFRLDVETPGGVRHLFALPGVPREMKPMFTEQVLPWLMERRGGEVVYLSRVFQTFGISESALDELVAGVVPAEHGRLSFRAAFPQISVRLTVRGRPEQAERDLEHWGNRLRERLGVYCYAEGEVSMEEAVGLELRRRGWRVAVAESCTGGLVGHRITNVPGSSAYFLGGVVAYSNEAKQSLLGVRAETLQRHGAVSPETAEEMAVGVQQRFGADAALSVTGIAGPEGGTAEKPVGTVCFGLVSGSDRFTRRYQLWGNREWIKLLASQIALDWLRRYALGAGLPETFRFR